MTGDAFELWRASARQTRARLARIIRNAHRFDDSTFARLLSRIDSAIAQDQAKLARAID